MELDKKSYFTISNFLSIVRILLVIPTVYVISIGRNDLFYYIAFIAILSDWLDGFLARKLNQITDLGKILDPVGDKVLIASVVIALFYYQGFPLWLMLVIVLRDVGILIGAFFIYDKQKQVTSSNWPGKISVTFIAVTILSFIAGWAEVFNWFIVLALLSIILSAFIYSKVFIKHYYSKKK